MLQSISEKIGIQSSSLEGATWKRLGRQIPLDRQDTFAMQFIKSIMTKKMDLISYTWLVFKQNVKSKDYSRRELHFFR